MDEKSSDAQSPVAEAEQQPSTSVSPVDVVMQSTTPESQCAPGTSSEREPQGSQADLIISTPGTSSEPHDTAAPGTSSDSRDSADGVEIPQGFEWIDKLPPQMREETIRILKHGMTDDERKAIYDKYPIPDNLKARLLPPKVNQEVWELLSPEAKYHDLTMCHIHTGIAHSIIALGGALKLLIPSLKSKTEGKNIDDAVVDISSLVLNSTDGYFQLGNTVTEGRRDFIMEFLSPEAQEEAKLTTSDEFLFGKDFQNGRTSRMMKKIKGRVKTKRFRARR